jgi:hypothetical protein
MAVLAESGGPRPPLSTRLDLLFDRSEWLIVVPFAMILAGIVLVQGSIAGGQRADPPRQGGLRAADLSDAQPFLPASLIRPC